MHMTHAPRSRSSLALLVLVGVLACKGDAKTGNDAAPAANESEPAKAAPSEAKPEGPTLPKAEALLEKAVEALGGREQLEAVRSFSSEGTVSVAKQNISGKTRTLWKAGDFYSETQVVGVGLVKVGKKGNVLWSDDPIQGLRQLGGQEAEQAGWQSTVALPASWKTFFDRAETVAEKDVDGTKVYEVVLHAASGDAVTMVLDAESGLPLRQRFKQVSPTGTVPVNLRFEDYREVDGIKVAHRQVANMTLMELTTSITAFQINPEVDAERFAMPTGGTRVVGPAGPNAEPGRKGMPFGPDGKPGRPAPSQQGAAKP